MNKQLLKIYDRELSEIKQHRKRLGALAASLVVSLLIYYTFTDSEEPAKATSQIEKPKIVEPKTKTKSATKNETKSKLKNVASLDGVSEDAEIVNPFKVDIVKPAEAKTEDKSKIPAPAFTPPAAPSPVKAAEPAEKVVLILKGVAISGDKKMAIIQRGTSAKNGDKDSKTSNDKNSTESFLLGLGDEIDGRRIVDMGRDFVTFNDGHKLHIQEAL